MAGAWEAESFRDIYFPTRHHRISGRRLPALAWSAKGRFLIGQSRLQRRHSIFAFTLGVEYGTAIFNKMALLLEIQP